MNNFPNRLLSRCDQDFLASAGICGFIPDEERRKPVDEPWTPEDLAENNKQFLEDKGISRRCILNGSALSLIFWASLAFGIWVGMRLWGGR